MPISRRVGQKPLEADAVRLKTWTGGQVSDPLITRDILPEATDAYDIGSSTLLYRKGWLSELDAIVFAQQTVQLLGGWLIVGHGEGTVNEDVDTTETQIDFGAGGELAQNDFVLFRSVGKVEYMQIGVNVSGDIWNVTRDLDGSGANAWPKGTPYLNLGYDGDGNISLNASATPRISMSTQGTAYNSITELIRIGDLDANWGYVAETYGFAVGEYGASKANVTVDVTNGIRIRDNATTMVELTPAGVVNIGAQASNYVKISGGIVYFYNGATLEGSLSGTTWTLGEATNTRVAITPSAVTMYDANGDDRVAITTGQIVVGDTTEGEYLVITSGGATLYGGGVAHLRVMSVGTFWAGDTSTTERIQWDTTNGLQIFNAANAAVFKAPTSGDVEIVGTLAVTSPGEVTAGGGVVVLDANGITLAEGTGVPNKIKWGTGAGIWGTLGNLYISLSGFINISSSSNMTTDCPVYVGGDLRASGGLYVGSVATIPANGAIHAVERSSDPSDPAEGNWIIWMSDGTGSGDDGDIMVKIQAGATVKTATLVDFAV